MHEPDDGFIGDKQRDHRQDDCTGKSGQVAELAGAEGEAPIFGMFSGIGVGERRQKKRTSVGGHVEAVRHQGDRPEYEAANDLGHHHRATQPNHAPSAALTRVMRLAEKHMVMAQVRGWSDGVRHALRFHFR